MKFGLSDEVIGKIHSVFLKYPEIEEAVIYGSRAKGNYRLGSDIDLTLKGVNVTEAVCSAVITEIDDLNTPYLFDISVFKNLNSPDLEEHIARVGKSFFTR